MVLSSHDKAPKVSIARWIYFLLSHHKSKKKTGPSPYSISYLSQDSHAVHSYLEYRIITLFISMQWYIKAKKNSSESYFYRSSPDIGSYTTTSRFDKKITDSRTYNSSFNEGVDTSPIIKVSSLDDPSTSRRDSWDAIAKTRNILSDRSLESVANLTESQLNSELRKSKAEEHSRFLLNEQSFQNEHNYKTNYSQNYSTYTTDNFIEKGYGRGSPGFKSIKPGGAAAVRVQPVPDGVLGQPVEFESEYTKYLTCIDPFRAILISFQIFWHFCVKYNFCFVLYSKHFCDIFLFVDANFSIVHLRKITYICMSFSDILIRRNK